MEIAIPLIALGGMYVISNQSTRGNNSKKEIAKSQQENFESMGLKKNYLPNNDIPVSNFPVMNPKELANTVQNYPNSNTATDKYFNQNTYENNARNGTAVGQNIPEVYSLTGDYMNSEQFKHNNMTPFYGAKIKGNTYDMNIAESVLDNMTGNGSQIIKKIEQAPLFKPEQNMQWTYGMPNQSDFYQSRVNPGMKNNNIKPFESIQVGPGLDHGYGTSGNNGFNSGMEARDKWLPKTVDELRVETNPKMEYDLSNLEGPANSFIKNIPTTQLLGRVEKQKPDTFYINTQDRWLTTTGMEKGETMRSIQETGIIRRNNCDTNYQGVAGPGDYQAGHAPENYEKSRKIQLENFDTKPACAVGRGHHIDTENNMKSHTNYENHRTTMKQPDTDRGGFGGAIGAVIAPLLDILKPTRKDETIHNIRIYGEGIGTTVPKGYLLNTQDTTNTTIKETTIYSPQFNVNNQKEGSYINNYTTPLLSQRETTSNEYYTAPGGNATGYGNMDYTAAYKQTNNDIKAQTVFNRPNQGGTQIFNQTMNLTNIKSDTDRLDGRYNPAYSGLSNLPPSKQTHGAIHMPNFENKNTVDNRIDPDLLNAFRSNPYTQSLSSAV